MTTPRYTRQPTTTEVATAAHLSPHEVLRFDHNTSPFPTDWALDRITSAARTLNEYPEADYRRIREAAANYAEVEPGNVLAGAGIDELIQLVANAFLDPDSSAVMVTPSYPLYRIATSLRGARTVELPLIEPDFAFPVQALLGASREADLTWLCAPNNPTGNHPGLDTVAALAQSSSGIVVVDAAYAEIAGDDWSDLATRFPNVIDLHTLSKAFGLAGARVGYAVGPKDLIRRIDGVRPPGSISSLSVELAVDALEEPNRMRRRVERIIRERTRLAAALDELEIAVLPSDANFLLCHVGDRAGEVAERLLEEGLVVRDYPKDSRLGQYLRFTVRLPNEDDRLLDALWRHLR
jgi:histidinol-phosphate aminotransferase